MTKYIMTFTHADGTVDTIIKEFATYMQAMNWNSEYFAKHRDVYYTTTKEYKS